MRKLECCEWRAVIIQLRDSLTIVPVFEDPGIDFYDLRNNELVVIEKYDDMHITPLYLVLHNRIYDLVAQDVRLPSGFFHHLSSPKRHILPYHERAAIHCLHILGGVTMRSEAGVKYATTYWARHISEAIMTKDLLKELKCIDLEQTTPELRITAADTYLVVKRLEVGVLFIFIPYLRTDGVVSVGSVQVLHPCYPCGNFTIIFWKVTRL